MATALLDRGLEALALADLTVDDLTEELIGLLDEEELAWVDEVLVRAHEAPNRPGMLPHQVPPDGNWRTWVIMGGRGTGKTQGCADAFYAHAHGPACDPRIPGGHRMGILAPTLGDAVFSCVANGAGLQGIDPRVQVKTRTGGTFADLPNGVSARLFGGYSPQDAERFRAGGNLCFVWVEEMAAIRQLGAVWTQMRLGLRIGPHPRIIASTTPRTKAAFKRILTDPGTVTTHGTTDDNPHLNPEVRAELYSLYKGTRVERQELAGELLEDIEGALWSQEDIDNRRIVERELQGTDSQRHDETRELWLRRVLRLSSVYVALDPATSGRGDETGIVVVGAGRMSREGPLQAFVLEDRTFLGVAGDWAAKAVEVAWRWQANAMLVEENRLGTTAAQVIRGAGFEARIISFSAKGSKFNRADPVQAAWGRACWLVGSWPKLEGQMTSWVPDNDSDKVENPDPNDPDAFAGSPDALDAMVHGVRRVLRIGAPIKRSGRPMTEAVERGWRGG